MSQDTKNFKVREFTCHCGCGYNVIDQKVMDIAQKIRDSVGSPVHVNSGCRCAAYNRRVGGVEGSYHTKGQAADLSCKLGGAKLFEVVADLKARGEIPALEYAILYNRKNFVHIDVGKVRTKYFEIRA